MTSDKVATNEQIIAEAERRWAESTMSSRSNKTAKDFIIEVVRENWTSPEPEPVDPDLLAFREWAARLREANGSTDWASAYRQGRFDHTDFAQAYLAGARMATERERKRAKPLSQYLQDRVAELEDALREVADDLEAEIKARAEGDLPRRVKRDLEPVSRARALLKDLNQ